MKYLEDFSVGQVWEFGSYTASKEEIIDFARKYDPQPFHIDEEAAKESIFGGVIASGWHTCGMFMRMLVENVLNEPGNLGSPGIDELRWVKPVYPGDTLSARVTITEIVPSRSKPDRGVVKYHYETFNQNGVLVMTMRGMGMYKRRPQ